MIKLLEGVLIAVILLGSGYLAYSFVAPAKDVLDKSEIEELGISSEDSEEISEQSGDKSAFDNKVFALRNGKLVEWQTISDSLAINAFDYRHSSLINRFPTISIDTEFDSSGSAKRTLYLENKDKQEIITTNTESIYFIPRLSPDGSKIIYFADKGIEDYSKFSTSAYLAVVDASADPTPDIVLNSAWTNEHGPLLPVGWAADNRTVILQDNGCLECHGGGSNTGLYSLDTITRELKYLFGAVEANDRRSERISTNGRYLVTLLDDLDYYISYPDTIEGFEQSYFTISVYDTVLENSRTLYEKREAIEISPDLVGWSVDGNRILVNVSKPIKYSGPYNLDYTYGNHKILSIDVISGDVITYEADKLINADERVTSATEYGDLLYYSTSAKSNTERYPSAVYSFDPSNEIKTTIVSSEGEESYRIIPIVLE